MAVQIQFRRGTAYEWNHINPTLAEAEMGIETDTKLFKIGDGTSTWTVLNYGGIQGYTGSRSTATVNLAVSNVLYVSKSGNDANNGQSLASTKLTIRSAVAAATTGTTIFVKSGDYTEITPIVVPKFVAIVGDNLRTVTVRSTLTTQDIFYVNNGAYLANMTFKGHESPAAAVSFPIDNSAGVISTSPYIQNCTSMTTDGTGLRVDGNLALGTKSMMVDAFTQYNQGGIGVHMLNEGYTSLVSVFTICCDIGVLCVSGGFCSITNSNSSFGNYALYADGVGAVKYTGNVNGSTNARTFTINNLNIKPSIGDALSFGDGNYYTIASSTALQVGNVTKVYPTILNEDATLRNARQTILDAKTKLQILTINHVLEAFPGFSFNQFKCSRDVGYIIDAVCYDMVLNTNYQSIKAGSSYYRISSYYGAGSELTETIDAINFLKTRVLGLLTPATLPWTRINNLFDTILDIITNGLGVVPAINYNAPTGASTSTVNAITILQANKDFIAEETVGYINNFSYNTTSCHRDTGLIVDSIAFDLLYGGTSQSTFAGLQYWNQTGYVGDIAREITTTSYAIAYLRDITIPIATAAAGIDAAPTITTELTGKFTSLLYVLNQGSTIGVTDLIIPNGVISTTTSTVAAYNAIISNKTTLQNNTIAWITSNYPTFAYNTATCYRDVGYILDSVAFDLLHGGNRQSIMSGVYYYGYSTTATVIANEIPQTTAAYNFIRNISADIIKGKLITSTYQTVVSQTISSNTGTYIEVGLINSKVSTITNIIKYGPSVAPAHVPIGLTPNTSTNIVNSFNLLLANRAFIQAETIAYVNTSYVGLSYSTATCKRDIGYIIGAMRYDILYGGNSQTIFAAEAYYDGGSLQISNTEKLASIAAYYHIGDILKNILSNIAVSPKYSGSTQNLIAAPPTTLAVINTATGLIGIVANLVENDYTSIVGLQSSVGSVINNNTPVTFHTYSQIQSSAHNFEWIGAGTNIDAALPYLGGEPLSSHQAVAINGGKVYFTGTDQQGDFRIGNDLVINNSIGTISGRTFTKSLFAVLTPYILAIGR